MNWIRKYNLKLLLNTLTEKLSLKHKYKFLFEYALLAGVNYMFDPTNFALSYHLRSSQ
ncbi:hypothetical protein HanIR_Chr01g0028541 [Helianthus annuus]|nr:hypothetical protein HanIR_Chr01g0028541 [Helianthus annuus]